MVEKDVRELKKRFFASLLALCMVIGMLPATALAAEEATVTVKSGEELQAALDNAVPGTTIQLTGGVNYGKVVFRQTASSTVVDITDAGGDAYGNEKYRRIENLTIIGAEGAVVDGFDFCGVFDSQFIHK